MLKCLMPPTQPQKNPLAQKLEQHHLLDHLVWKLSNEREIQGYGEAKGHSHKSGSPGPFELCLVLGSFAGV